MNSQHIKAYTLPSRTKGQRANQNLSISMSLPTLTEEKYDRTTFCTVHSGFSVDFEHYHSPVVQWFTENEISHISLRHHTIYRSMSLRPTSSIKQNE